jgi:hypothetical protein
MFANASSGNIPNWSPVVAGGFHRDLSHFAVLQPAAQLFEIPCKRSKFPLLDSQVRLAHGRQHTHRHTVLMDIDAATAALLRFHKLLLVIAERRTPGMG